MLAPAAAMLVLVAGVGIAEEPDVKMYAMEMQGKVVGYSEVTYGTDDYDGRPAETVRTEQFVKLSLLGSPMDQRNIVVSYRRPGEVRAIATILTQAVGDSEARVSCTFSDDTAVCEVYAGGRLARKLKLPLSSDTVIPWDDDYVVTRARRLAADSPGSSVDFELFYLAAISVTDATLTYEGPTVVSVRGKQMPAGRFLLRAVEGGVRVRYFVTESDAGVVRVEVLDSGAVMYPADAVVADKLKRADITDTILAQVDLRVADVAALKYVKVRAELASVGPDIDASSLNTQWQSFEGTVRDKVVEGVFEIRRPTYDGADAPPFPMDARPGSGLRSYLEAGAQIESDHPEIIRLAEELADGAADAWEVATRTADWVYRNIRYEIPGGGSALNSLRTRAAECGGHSRLHVALCRAAGVPARLVTGGMYTPAYGGSFGQHAWVEVYMGTQNGWIPIDATAGETSFADAGHIRLGESAPFRPRTVTVLDYEPKKEHIVRTAAALDPPYPVGRPVVFHFVYNGAELGTETVTIQSLGRHEGEPACFLSSKLALSGVTATSETALSPTGRPLRYEIEGKTAAYSYRLRCEFGDGAVDVILVKGDVESEHRIDLPEDVMLFDNNHLGHFAFMLSRFDLADAAKFTIQAFHPSSLSVLPLDVSVGEVEEVDVRGVTYSAYRITIGIAGQQMIMHVTEDGALVRDAEQGGRLVIEADFGGDGGM